MKNGIQELGDMVKGNCIHYWIIDSNDVGVCRYCREERDFRKLLRKAEKSVVGSGPASLVKPNRRRGRKPKEALI